jgi:hypothetical protein
MWCIQEMTPEYRMRMYDLLDLYELPYNAKKPVICMDEKSKQLLGEKRKPLSQKPGSPLRYDYEYTRNGTRNIFVAVEPKGGRRVVTVTKRRARCDFARFVTQLADKEYPSAEKLQVVVDNLNTHFEKSFTETFPRKEADRILERVEFHYTPKHGSWLNMAEIEINVMGQECLGTRRFPQERVLAQELRTWERERNKNKSKIVWKFTRQDADAKLSKHYVV